WHNTVGHISSSIQIVGWTPITPTGNNYLELTNGTILKLADTLNLECLCNQGGGTLQVETQPYGREYTSVQVGQIKKIVIKTIEENEHSQHIRPGFLDGAYNLETLELNDCTEITSSHIITTILDSFLGNCIRLTTIDLSSLTNLTSVGERFLDSTQNVGNIKMPNVNPNNIPTLQSWGNNIGPVDSNPVNLICKTNQLMNAYMSSTWAQVEGHFESGATWVVG
ncbi:MAG: hypothetical protein HUJ52_01820, partial [Malacoplasma sp.]|nr:hypothetical protein [Malacoplasma sp.]